MAKNSKNQTAAPAAEIELPVTETAPVQGSATVTETPANVEKRGPGRPKGSTNGPKGSASEKAFAAICAAALDGTAPLPEWVHYTAAEMNGPMTVTPQKFVAEARIVPSEDGRKAEIVRMVASGRLLAVTVEKLAEINAADYVK